MDDRQLPDPRYARLVDGRELVDFITTEHESDLIVAYAISLEEPGEIASLILQRSPDLEFILPPEERGVVVSHELNHDDSHDLVRKVVVRGTHLDIVTEQREYHLELAHVDADELADSWSVLKAMQFFGGFEVDFS